MNSDTGRRLLRVKSARDLGPQFTNNPHRMVGQDGAYSIPLRDGEALWFFGDTLIGERPNGSLWYLSGEPVGGKDMSGRGSFEQMITNTGLILCDRTGRHGLRNYSYVLGTDGRLKQLVPTLPEEDPDEIRIWCLNGCRLGDRIYLYYIKVQMHEKGGNPFPVGFDILGSGLAIGSESDWSFTRIDEDGDTILWTADQPQFASAVLVGEATDKVYLYGSLQGTDAVQRAYVARVSPESIADRDAYEYFAGDFEGWSGDVEDAAPVFSGPPNEMSVSHNPYLGGYLAVHSMGLTGEIVGRTSPTPWGPWSDAVTLWVVPPPDESPPYPRLVYAGKEHPELAEEGGRVLYITYIEFEEYFPHLVEVSLE